MPLLSWTDSLHHDGSPRYVGAHAGRIGDTVTLRLRAGRDAPITSVFLRTCPDGEQALTAMHRVDEDNVCQWWEAELRLQMPRTAYRFVINTDEGRWALNAAGMWRHTPTDHHDFKLLANYAAPHWVRDAVFYQIFPDRFHDGDPASNVQTGEYRCYQREVVARPWGERPLPPGSGAAGGVEFFGGDLPGIVQRLDYLHDLGVTALYLTPIFVSPSNHKYDVVDYRHVDPHFGGDAALVELRRALDERGMRLLLDIVPNHCSVTHPWFLAAREDPDAPTADYFTFRQRPDDYVCWLGVKSLPKLNYRSQQLREEMYAGREAIVRHWLREPFRIDGWRVDVANMLARQGETQLGHTIGRAVRRAIKEEQPHAYLVGENFFDGTSHLQGDELDATMNYQGFTIPLLHWLAPATDDAARRKLWRDPVPLSTEALAAQWIDYFASIPWQIAMQQFNLLGSHDTPRSLTALGDSVDRQRVAAALLFTFPGVPSVYYGDEIGLEGGPDPDCRRCMPWDRAAWNQRLFAWYRELIALRRTSPALRWGGFQLLHAAEATVAYLREAPEERLIVVARRGPDGVWNLPVRAAGLPNGATLRECFTGAFAMVESGMLSLRGLTGTGVQIWRVAG